MSWWNKHASRLILRTDGLIDRCDVLQSIPTNFDKWLLSRSITNCSGVKWALITASLCFVLLRQTPTGLVCQHPWTSLDSGHIVTHMFNLLCSTRLINNVSVFVGFWFQSDLIRSSSWPVSGVWCECAALCWCFWDILGSCCYAQPPAPQKMNTLLKCQIVTPTPALLRRFRNKLRTWCLFSHQRPLRWIETSGLRLRKKSL